jgi:hypothetical protein
MNSRQPSRYIKNGMGKNLKRRILTEHGIEVEDDESLKIKQSANNCPRCKFVNVFENKYCGQCSYPLSISVYEEIKKEEEARMVQLESKYEEKIKAIIEDVDNLKSKTKRYFDIAYPDKISRRPTAQTSALVTRVIENGGMS